MHDEEWYAINQFDGNKWPEVKAWIVKCVNTKRPIIADKIRRLPRQRLV